MRLTFNDPAMQCYAEWMGLVQDSLPEHVERTILGEFVTARINGHRWRVVPPSCLMPDNITFSVHVERWLSATERAEHDQGPHWLCVASYPVDATMLPGLLGQDPSTYLLTEVKP